MKSEFRGIIAIVLSMLVLIVWYTVIAPSSSPLPATGVQPTGKQEKTPTPAVESAIPLTTATSSTTEAIHTKIERPKGEEAILENSLVQVIFNTMGGVIERWELKEFTKNGNEAKKRVSLADPQGTSLEVQLRHANASIPFPIPYSVVSQGSGRLELRWESKELAIWKRLQLDPDSYLAKMELEVINHQNQTVSFVPSIDWTKQPIEESPQMGVLFFKTPPDQWHPIYYREDALHVVQPAKMSESQFLSGRIGWIGAESRYFLGSIVPLNKQGEGLEEGKTTLPTGETFLYTRLLLPQAQILPGESWIQKFHLYGGPKELKSLKAVGPGMDKAIGYGWTSVIAVPILYLLQFFYGIVHNYGIAIILLTVLVKLLLNPINRKSLKSMKAMQQLQPKIQELKKKYGQDKQQINLQMMQLFKAHKINPMGGCLPMLLQFPIYIALYKVLWGSVELYHAPFLWFYKDLSAPDPYLITPALLAVTMYFQTKMTPNPSADPAQQKIMLIMPVMFSVIMVFLPMGLCLYILINTAMTILQQWMYNKGIRMRDLVRGRI